MKKFFGLRPPNVRSRSVFRKRPQSDDVGRQPETGGGVTTESRYRIRDKDLQEIHKAAYRGDVSEVQRLLSLHPERLNDRDRKKRTALHLACAFGHPEVVTLLAEKKCQMNFGDNKNRTALMKAVECQEEECATILLKHGADPHMKDFRSNTALHYAAMGHNTAIAEQLLRHQADMEATNE